MKNIHQDVMSFLASQKQEMLSQLHQFCEINSGTKNIQGLGKMREALRFAFQGLADEIHAYTFPPITSITLQGENAHFNCGEALFIRKRPHLKRRVLLCGHMDTVYAVDHPFQRLSQINAQEIRGPGVADMKGGLVVMNHALKAFEGCKQAEELGWDVLINADEEIGSPSSSSLLVELAPQYQAALVYEPAITPKGTLAKNRKGSGKFTLIATGKAAHAGRDLAEGRNAIAYLAKVLLDLDELNGKRAGLSLNIGQIAGGTAVNMVPDKALIKMDLRISKNQDADWLSQQMKKIFKAHEHPDYSLSLHGGFGRPVKQITASTKQLFSRLQQNAELLQLNLDWKDSGGCCDGNNLAEAGLPVLDTLGVRGGHIHSPDEFILIDSLEERAALSTLLLLDLAQGGLETLRK